MYYTNVAVERGKILLRGVDGEKEIKQKLDFKPVLYVPTPHESHYKDIYGNPLHRVDLESIYDYWKFKKDNPDRVLYGDISPTTQYISQTWPDQIEYDASHLNVCNIDIEVDSPDGFPSPEEAAFPVVSIAMRSTRTGQMHVWGLEHTPGVSWREETSELELPYSVDYRPFYSEEGLLLNFIDFWTTNYPDIITGWFIDGFDIPYLINRTINLGLIDEEENVLSPWRIIKKRKLSGSTAGGVNYKDNSIYSILGVASLDYILLYKKYSYTPQESYKLNHIAYSELGDTKIKHDGLAKLYRKDYQKFIDYNIKDVDIVERIDNQRQFLRLVIDMAYYAKINFEEVLSPIRIWDSLIYNELKKDNIQIAPESRASKDSKYAGAFVKEPQIGKFGWLMSADLASLYPSLMRGINISPDTLIGQFENELSIQDIVNGVADVSSNQHSLAANGVQFSREKEGFLPKLLTELYLQRKSDKGKMLEYKKKNNSKEALRWHVKQYAKKVLLNSAYGAAGNPYFRWYDLRLAEAVTYSGQVAIQWIERKINEYMNKILKTEGIDYIIYIDTDSVYINVDPLVQKLNADKTNSEIVDILDKFYKQALDKAICAGYDELAEYMKHFNQLMFMDREAIADKGIWAGKKHYALRLYDNEGVKYDPPKIKVTGMAFIKTDVPEVCRNKIRDLLPIAFSGTNQEMINAINKFKNEFMSMDPENIARVQGVKEFNKYRDRDKLYKKGSPIGAKSALIYNYLHEKHGLGIEHPPMTEGDKLKYLYLIPQNPHGFETIGFINQLPKEFNVDDFIDWETMWEKSFMGPLEEILSAIGWKRKIVTNLSGLFG